MLLSEWLWRAGKGGLSKLQRDTGLSYTAVLSAAYKKRAVRIRTARLISAATGCTLEEVFEPGEFNGFDEPPTRKRRAGPKRAAKSNTVVRRGAR
jgi:hypothetical protein